MLADMPASRNNHNTDTLVLDTSLGFIEAAKERLKYLENEGQCIDQNYRDYQHKVKSKYYPISDDPDSEMRITSQKKVFFNGNLDVEKFMELTLRANVSAKVAREELEIDVNKNKVRSVIRFLDFYRVFF